MIERIDQLVEALPQDSEVHPNLVHNLAVLSLCLEGCVDIIGIERGRLMSLNTPKGAREAYNIRAKNLEK